MKFVKKLLSSFAQWFDTSKRNVIIRPEHATSKLKQIDWLRVTPFILMHVVCLAVFWVGFSWTALLIACVMYALRIFAIGGFYHRYFSHRTFETTRLAQFIFAILGASAVQRGPIWWAAHHRQHHVVSDQPEDAHSPVQHGFFWSHMGWFMSRQHFHANLERVKDWLKFPELRFLDRYDVLVPVLVAISLFILGQLLAVYAPGLNTNGWQLLIWGFFISTIAVFHATACINSLTHVFGKKRYPTKDESRNSWLLALLTFGEGWHNNHHYYPASTRQGFFWWEIDLTYYCLKLLSLLGIIWDLKPVPKHIKQGVNQ